MRRVVAHFYLLCMAAVIVSCSGVGKRPNIRAYNCFVRMGLYQEGVERLLAEGGVRRVRHYSFATCLNGNLKRLCSRAKRLEDIAARLRRSDPFGAAEAMMAMAVVYAAAGERERAGSRFKSALTFYSKCLNQRALFHGLFGRLKKAECYRARAVCSSYLKRSRFAAWNMSRALSLIGTGSSYRRIHDGKKRLFAAAYLERAANTMAVLYGPDSNVKRQPERNYFRSGRVMESAAVLAPADGALLKGGTASNLCRANVFLRAGERYEDFAEAAVRLHESSSGIYFLKLAERMYRKSLSLSAPGRPGENAAIAGNAVTSRERARNRRKQLGG